MKVHVFWKLAVAFCGHWQVAKECEVENRADSCHFVERDFYSDDTVHRSLLLQRLVVYSKEHKNHWQNQT